MMLYLSSAPLTWEGYSSGYLHITLAQNSKFSQRKDDVDFAGERVLNYVFSEKKRKEMGNAPRGVMFLLFHFSKRLQLSCEC